MIHQKPQTFGSFENYYREEMLNKLSKALTELRGCLSVKARKHVRESLVRIEDILSISSSTQPTDRQEYPIKYRSTETDPELTSYFEIWKALLYFLNEVNMNGFRYADESIEIIRIYQLFDLMSISIATARPERLEDSIVLMEWSILARDHGYKHSLLETASLKSLNYWKGFVAEQRLEM